MSSTFLEFFVFSYPKEITAASDPFGLEVTEG
jgi:hypothetical protein